VVGLQRAAGNAAVTRLLARQGLTDEAIPTGPGPVRIDRNDVIINTVRGPTLNAYGAYAWYVTFQLPFAAESDGFIIQELYQENSESTYVEHFWECWRVRSGERTPVDRSEDYDDRYRNLDVPGAVHAARGWRRHTGVIRFYPGPLPSEFGAEDPNVHFYITRTRPSVWTGAGTRHDCYSEWDTGRGRNGLVAYAGSTELRAGDTVTFRPRSAAVTP
jgi:hypothetical protein